jgi:hypothetical protein
MNAVHCKLPGEGAAKDICDRWGKAMFDQLSKVHLYVRNFSKTCVWVPISPVLLLILWWTITMMTAPALAQAAERNKHAVPPTLVYVVIVVVLAGTLVGTAAVRAAVSGTAWSLSDALSEEVEVTFEQDVDGVRTPKFDDNLKPIMVTELRASSSRLIALMGLITIMLMFVGFGVFVLYSFAFGDGVPPGLDDVLKYILAGMTMFAPYVVNKFASVFDWITPKTH